MRLLHRLGYYLGGFSIGLIVLAFFFSGKKTSCAYFPEARVLKKLTTKKMTFSEEAQQTATTLQLDTLSLKTILKKGEVDFGESQPRKEPCGIYLVNGETTQERKLLFTIENCEDFIKILEIKREGS